MWINGFILLDRDREEDMVFVGCMDFCGWDFGLWFFLFFVRYIVYCFFFSLVNK